MTKQEFVEDCLTQGVTHIVLDARQPGVVVPENLRREDLQLKISYRFNPPDLEVNERGISCTLSFNRVWHAVFVPWAALWAAVGNGISGTMWERPAEPPVLTKRRGGLGLVS